MNQQSDDGVKIFIKGSCRKKILKEETMDNGHEKSYINYLR